MIPFGQIQGMNSWDSVIDAVECLLFFFFFFRRLENATKGLDFIVTNTAVISKTFLIGDAS